MFEIETAGFRVSDEVTVPAQTLTKLLSELAMLISVPEPEDAL